MSPVSSSVGNAAYALYQATLQVKENVVQQAQKQQQRNEQIATELIQARVKQTQLAAEVQKNGPRIDTYA